jgi:hypothetical protein
MATPNMEVKISVEKVIHDLLREAIQLIQDKHGIRVSQLNFDWQVSHTVGEEPQYEVAAVRALTLS